MIRRGAILATVLVAGCAAQVYRSREALIGMSATDLIACAGVPNQSMRNGPNEVLLQWDEKPAAGSAWLVLPTLFGTVRLGAPSECHFHARVLRDGTVAGVSFSGPSIADDAGSCSGLIAECYVHPDSTRIPAGFDAFEMLKK